MSSAPVFIPDELRNPIRYKYVIEKADKYGVYDCDSDNFKCISKRDHGVLDLNVENLRKAHFRILNIVDKHNDMGVENIYKPEKCKWWQFKCKKYEYQSLDI